MSMIDGAITVESLLRDIRQVYIPKRHVERLILEIQLRAHYIQQPNTRVISAHAQIVLHPCIPPPVVVIPYGHEIAKYNGFVYVQPLPDMQGPFYIVTRGKLVGLFSQWIYVAPQVERVSGAVYEKIQKLDDGFMLLIGAIDDMLVEYL
ncbi:hypothetical protein EV363DRAFT_1302061 [Boletus edulis]|nr:hypothetical protein EV363DRAFT_1302061 [Boletus edulis]